MYWANLFSGWHSEGSHTRSPVLFCWFSASAATVQWIQKAHLVNFNQSWFSFYYWSLKQVESTELHSWYNLSVVDWKYLTIITRIAQNVWEQIGIVTSYSTVHACPQHVSCWWNVLCLITADLQRCRRSHPESRKIQGGERFFRRGEEPTHKLTHAEPSCCEASDTFVCLVCLTLLRHLSSYQMVSISSAPFGHFYIMMYVILICCHVLYLITSPPFWALCLLEVYTLLHIISLAIHQIPTNRFG